MQKHINCQSSSWCSFAGHWNYILEEEDHILLGVVRRVEGHRDHVDSQPRFREVACMDIDVGSMDAPSLDRIVLESGKVVVVVEV